MADFRSRWGFKAPSGEVVTVPIAGRTVIPSAIALKQCAVAGMGIALLPNWLVATELKAGTLADLFPACRVTATEFDTAAWMVYPSRTYVPLKVRVFMGFLLQQIHG